MTRHNSRHKRPHPRPSGTPGRHVSSHREWLASRPRDTSPRSSGRMARRVRAVQVAAPERGGTGLRPAPMVRPRQRPPPRRFRHRPRPRSGRHPRDGSGRCPEARSGTAGSALSCARPRPRPCRGKAGRRTSNGRGNDRCRIPEIPAARSRGCGRQRDGRPLRPRRHPCHRRAAPRYRRRRPWPGCRPGIRCAPAPTPSRSHCFRRRTARATTTAAPGSSSRETRLRPRHLHRRNRRSRDHRRATGPPRQDQPPAADRRPRWRCRHRNWWRHRTDAWTRRARRNSPWPCRTSRP